ncbi:hypothetical protein D3C71_1382140 [compost metagenome]
MTTKVAADGGVMHTAPTEPVLKKLKSVFAGNEQYTTNSFYSRIVEEMKSGKPMIVIIHDSMCHPDDNPEIYEYPNAKVYFPFELDAVAFQVSTVHKAIDKARKANPSIVVPKLILAINNPGALHYVNNSLDFKNTELSCAAQLADEVYVTMRVEQIQEKA